MYYFLKVLTINTKMFVNSLPVENLILIKHVVSDANDTYGCFVRLGHNCDASNVTNSRCEMPYICLTLQEFLPSALVASKLLKSMSHKTNDPNLEKKFQQDESYVRIIMQNIHTVIVPSL